MSLFKRSKTVFGALGVAAFLAATAVPASADGGRVAAGVIGGLAAGAILGGALASQPGYYAPAYGYPYHRCWFARQRVYNHWGRFIGFRRVRVCR